MHIKQAFVIVLEILILTEQIKYRTIGGMHLTTCKMRTGKANKRGACYSYGTANGQ